MFEILFRGKRLDNGKWAQGQYLYDDVTGKGWIILSITESQNTIGGLLVYCVEVDPETVGQFTGQADQKGNRAFTDSVIRYSGEYGHVVYGVVRFGEIPANPGWDLQNIGFWVEWQNDGANMWDEWWRNDLKYWLAEPQCEIIGNRFDNPELLEGAS